MGEFVTRNRGASISTKERKERLKRNGENQIIDK